MRKGQGALEYLIIIAAVLVIAGVVVLLVSGAIGGKKPGFIINTCREAAAECSIAKLADPDATCEACVEACTDPTSDKEIFDGAIKCCKLGRDDLIYEGATGCNPSSMCGDGTCDPDENTENCPQDCPAGPNNPPTASAGPDQIVAMGLYSEREEISPSEGFEKRLPGIYDNWVIWIDSNADLYAYNLNTKQKKQVASGTVSSSRRPSIYENKIVWIDVGPSLDEVYMYDLSTNTATKLVEGGTTSGSPHTAPKEYQIDNVVIHDKKLAFSFGYNTNRDWIAVFNIDEVSLPIKVNEILLDTYPEVTVVDPQGGSDTYHPVTGLDLYDNLLVYSYFPQASSGYAKDVLASYDLSTDTQIDYGPGTAPSLYENKIIYYYYTMVYGSIYYQVLPAGDPNLITSDAVSGTTSTNRPDIYGSTVVWVNKSVAGNWDIAIKNIVTGIETPLTRGGPDQKSPSIYGDKIVFVNGSDQIVMMTVPTKKAKVDFSGTGGDSDGTIVSWSWNFGDGQTGTGKSITHYYTSTGTYTVTLTVIDDDGATATDTAIVTVA